MGTAVRAGPSLCGFPSKRGLDVQGQCRLNGVGAFCCHHTSSELNLLLHFRAAVSSLSYGCASGSQLAVAKQGLTRVLWAARSTQGLKKSGSTLIVCNVDRLGLDPVVDGNASEEDASCQGVIDTRSSLDSTTEESSMASEAGSLELVDTDGIIFEETDEEDGSDINGMFRQPRSFLVEDLDNWEMFAAEEGARLVADDDSESDSEMEGGLRPVRRRRAEDVLPFPKSAAMNWTAADKEKVKALQAFKHR